MPARKVEPQPELAIEEDEDGEEEDGEEGGEEEEVGDETDEELHPLRTTAPSEEVEDLLAVPLTQCPGWRGLASDGAVLLEALLPGRVALEASRSCQRLRDEECLSYMFSNPASQMAPPCGAEAIFLDDKAQAQAGTALLQALRKLREAVAALGEGELVSAGLPMVGTLVGGVALDLINWPTGTAIKSAADVPPDTLFNLGLLFGPIVSGFAIVSVWCYSHYNLTREQHQDILNKLEAKREPDPT